MTDVIRPAPEGSLTEVVVPEARRAILLDELTRETRQEVAAGVVVNPECDNPHRETRPGEVPAQELSPDDHSHRAIETRS